MLAHNETHFTLQYKIATYVHDCIQSRCFIQCKGQNHNILNCVTAGKKLQFIVQGINLIYVRDKHTKFNKSKRILIHKMSPTAISSRSIHNFTHKVDRVTPYMSHSI